MAEFSIFHQHVQLPLGNSTRQVNLYSLKKHGELGDIIIYCTDGQTTGAFAKQFYKTHQAEGIWFAGVNNSPVHRNAEYVIGKDRDLFEYHEDFFVSTVVDWVCSFVGIKHENQTSAIFGYSNGGAFAASMGIRHPNVFGTVFAFSIAGRPVKKFTAPPILDLTSVDFYLRAGSREPIGMRSYMNRLQTWLSAAGTNVDNATLTGGHDFALWSNAINQTIPMAYGDDFTLG